MNARHQKLVDKLPELSSITGKGSKKGEIPVFGADIVGDEAVAAVDSYLKAKVDKDKAEAKMATAKEVVLPAGVSVLDDLASEGRCLKSIKIEGKEGSVVVSRPDKFSVTQGTSMAILREVFGEAFAAENFVETSTIVLNPEVVRNKDLFKELINSVGKENFGKFFAKVTDISVNEGFDERLFQLPEELRVQARAGIVKQTSASIK